MSIDDDEYDLDDEFLDDAFEDDLEAELEDFDEEDGVSFDEDEVLFTDDELEEHAAEEEELLGAEKKKFSLNIGVDKIAIFGAVLVGIIVLVFQVTTKTAEQRVDIFQSVLTMKGATDGEVFGESQVENIATISPEEQKEQQAFLYEPEALDRLKNNLKDGEIVGDTVISPIDPNAVQEKPRDSGFISNRETRANISQQGEFVSATTGEVVEQDVTGFADTVISTEQPTARRPQPRTPDVVSEEEQIVSDFISAEPEVVQPIKEQTQDSVKPIEQVKQRLNFVPIDQVAVKEQPATPKVADRRVLPQVDVKEEDPIAVMQPTPTPVSTPDSAVVVQTQAAKNELRKIQQELAQLREEKKDLAKQTAEMRGEVSKLAAAPKPKAPAVAVKAEPKPKPVARPKPAPKATTSVPRRQQTASTGTAPTLTNWQLRAAQPNKAWISKTGQRDITEVSVGDSIQGLGRVMAITNRNGQWFVVGTDGQITQ